MAPSQGGEESSRGTAATTQCSSQLPADTGKIFIKRGKISERGRITSALTGGKALQSFRSGHQLEWFEIWLRQGSKRSAFPYTDNRIYPKGRGRLRKRLDKWSKQSQWVKQSLTLGRGIPQAEGGAGSQGAVSWGNPFTFLSQTLAGTKQTQQHCWLLGSYCDLSHSCGVVLKASDSCDKENKITIKKNKIKVLWLWQKARKC